MGAVYFPSVHDFGIDVPWSMRLEIWKIYLSKNPCEWFLIYKDDNRRKAFHLSSCLRQRGCLTAVHRYSDGSYALYAAIWRFDDEDS